MDKNKHKVTRRIRRHKSIRGSLVGTPGRPRMAVYKSLKHISVQVIDDMAGKTLASASSTEKGLKSDKTGNAKSAAAIGKAIAERAAKAGVTAVCFDRGGFKYHGRVKALADAAREAGLKF
ncbi:MAG TPA: 50S ribosomal protein L18 [Phycisphaerales bacterium]|jgi:large subunit ribosomal protein L18|nr:50S ribosomal protein L18 [Phycisphaerales bacterium]